MMSSFYFYLAQVEEVEIADPAWSPYVVGAGIGVLSWFTVYVSGKALGASGGYATIAGMLGREIAPGHTRRLQYYEDNPPKLNWSVILLMGMVLGAFVAAWSGGELFNRFLPPMWEQRFGEGTGWLRTICAFGGGILMAYGARLAGGCTSGHGISGTMRLSPGSWVSACCFFIGGIAAASVLYRF